MNDFLMAAASATAGAPDPVTLEVLAEAGFDVAGQTGETATERDEERTG